MARAGWGLVYGGTSVGLMGALAGAALAEGGEVIGVLPQALQDREVAHRALTTLHLVGSMHQRKALMESLSDAFIVLPGGYGTLDEMFEIVTWAQLRIHSINRVSDADLTVIPAASSFRPNGSKRPAGTRRCGNGEQDQVALNTWLCFS